MADLQGAVPLASMSIRIFRNGAAIILLLLIIIDRIGELMKTCPAQGTAEPLVIVIDLIGHGFNITAGL